MVDLTCHVSSGRPSASLTARASIVLPVPGSPFTSSGRSSAIAASTATLRSSVAHRRAGAFKTHECLVDGLPAGHLWHIRMGGEIGPGPTGKRSCIDRASGRCAGAW